MADDDREIEMHVDHKTQNSMVEIDRCARQPIFNPFPFKTARSLKYNLVPRLLSTLSVPSRCE